MIDEANVMVCSPSARDQQWRRKGSAELGKNSPTSESSNLAHHDVKLDEINSMMVSVCTGSSRFRRKKLIGKFTGI
jgi:hypothetical protein